MGERGLYAIGRKRREAILAATLKVFSQSGYRGTSLRAIAREVGISSSLIQHYFATREELLIELIKAWDAENARLSAGLPPIDSLLSNIQHNMTIPGLVHLDTAFAVEATDPDHPAGPYYDQRCKMRTSNVAADLRLRQQEATAPADLDINDTARLLIATREGLQIRWLHTAHFDMHAKFWTFLATLGLEPYRSHPLKLAAAAAAAAPPSTV